MKKILILCLLLAFACKTFAQIDTATQRTSVKTDYLKKSKTQKTVAWVLLGAGTAMLIGGLIAANSGAEDINVSETVSGSAFIATGIVIDLVSIPFFISSSKNRKRALAVTIQNQSVPKLMNAGLVRTPLPSIAFTIKL